MNIQISNPLSSILLSRILYSPVHLQKKKKICHHYPHLQIQVVLTMTYFDLYDGLEMIMILNLGC